MDPGSCGDALSATQSFQDDADLLFGGILLPRLAADIADRLLGGIFRRHQFLSHLRSPTGLYDEPKILPYAKTSICPKVADVKQLRAPETIKKHLTQRVRGFLPMTNMHNGPKSVLTSKP